MSGVPRIYFDTNVGPAASDGSVYGLWLSNSLSDLAAIPGGPKEGMRVVVYMTGELELEAFLKRDPASGRWLASVIANTTTFLDGSAIGDD
jgi:hypothetical protein